ncbi:hypothetical protein SLE2022_139380 [Rubroshorea leprosula]
MESEVYSTPKDFVQCCDCGCSCSLISTSSGAWIRSVKRKYDEFEAGNQFYVPEIDVCFNARVQIENECVALREMVCNQQQAIQGLHRELEEERNASSSAANEAMGMILRLQREKAEIQMESRQFKRFAEEKMAHDQQEILAMEDLLYKREQAIHSLTCEVQAYKHRMMSYGLTEEEAEGGKGEYSGNMSIAGNSDTEFDIPAFDYPPLRCNTNEIPVDDEGEDVEKYAFGETPHAQEQLRNLEFRIYQMERNPSSNQLNQLDGDVSRTKNVMEKVIVGHSPKLLPRHFRRFSIDSLNSMVETPGSASDFDSPRFNTTFRKMENISEVEVKSYSTKMDTVSEYGDDMSDRVYTIDSVHNGVPYNASTEPKAGVGICDDFVTTPRESLNLPDIGDPDIVKLYTRLQALEADRESMRQAIMSMRTDKAQLVLLKEIAQHLCKEKSPEKQKPIRKLSLPGASKFMSVFKWVSSFVFWRKKAHRSKYMHGMSPNNVGLLMLLDKGPRTRQWRCLLSTQV